MDPQPDYGESTYRGSGRLQGQRALITGADSGIGRGVAIAFAREGADVVESEDDDARETERLVKGAGRRRELFRCDLSSTDHCRKLVRDVSGATIAVTGGKPII